MGHILKTRDFKKLKLTLSHYNVIGNIVSYDDLVNDKDIKIEFIDEQLKPIGGYDMRVTLDEFEISGSYSDSGLLKNNIVVSSM